MLVSEAMVQSLLNEGVEVLFGYPGAAICPFYDALKKTPIRHILVRTEQNAGHAAGGYARISGKCGVCIATSGPGATNLISGIASAYMDSVPLVVITGQVDSHLLGRDVFQEVDTTGMVEPFIKHSYLLKNPADTCRSSRKPFTSPDPGGRGRCSLTCRWMCSCRRRLSPIRKRSPFAPISPAATATRVRSAGQRRPSAMRIAPFWWRAAAFFPPVPRKRWRSFSGKHGSRRSTP